MAVAGDSDISELGPYTENVARWKIRSRQQHRWRARKLKNIPERGRSENSSRWAFFQGADLEIAAEEETSLLEAEKYIGITEPQMLISAAPDRVACNPRRSNLTGAARLKQERAAQADYFFTSRKTTLNTIRTRTTFYSSRGSVLNIFGIFCDFKYLFWLLKCASFDQKILLHNLHRQELMTFHINSIVS